MPRWVWFFLLLPLVVTGCEKPTAPDLFAAIKAQRLDRVKSVSKSAPELLSSRDSDGRTPLCVAAAIGNNAVVEALLANGAKPDETDKSGLTPLHIAIKEGHATNALRLLEHGASVTQADPQGYSPLWRAASKGQGEVVRFLLTKKPDLNATDVEGETVLHAAIRSRNLEVVQALVNAGADLRLRDRVGRKPVELAGDEGSMEMFDYFQKKGQTAVYDRSIHEMVANGKLLLVGHLLNQKKELANAEGARGNRPLHFSCLDDRVDIATLLVQNGANVGTPNGVGNTPLHECSLIGSEKVARFLIQRKAPINATNRKGETALHLAVKNGKKPFVKLLLASKAESNGTDRLGRTPLSYAGDPEMVDLLLASGASKGAKDLRGVGLFEWLVHNGCARCAEMVLEGGVKLEDFLHENERFEDSLGQTSLHYAALFGRVKAVETLLGKGASVNARVPDTGATPLHLASRSGHAEVVRLLLSKSADPNALTKKDETALHWAADGALSPDVAKLLLEAKLDPTVENDRGETVLDIGEWRSEQEKDKGLAARAKAFAKTVEKNAK